MRLLRLEYYHIYFIIAMRLLRQIKGGIKMSQLYVRLSDELHAKLRVIAALKNESLNQTMIESATCYVQEWEKKHGELPLPPSED